MQPTKELNIAAALEYSRQCREEENADKMSALPLPGAEMADAMTSGLTGMALARCLAHHFPRAKRSEVYVAVGLAMTLMQADLTLAHMEIDILRGDKPLKQVTT